MSTSFRVLLVEDDPVDVMTVERACRAFLRDGMIDVMESAESALDYLAGAHAMSVSTRCLPDLVLADLRLPRLSGLDLLERIKGDPRLHAIPVVVFSTSVQDSEVDRAYESGAAGYFEKPVRFADFASSMEKILSYWMQASRPSMVDPG